MKLTKYFMPLAAVALLASCSNDNIDAPAQNGPDKVDTGVDGFYVALNLTQAKTQSSRTATKPDNQMATEQGQDYENFINDALVIFADGNENYLGSKVFYTYESIPSNSSSDVVYKTRGKFTQDEVADLFVGVDNAAAQPEIVFIVANSTNAPTNFVKGETVQKQLSASTYVEAGQKYWTKENFMMSGVADIFGNFDLEDFQDGKYNTEAKAYKLTKNPVEVQRVMARFDVNTSKVNFAFDKNGKTEADVEEAFAPVINVKMVGMAVTNMSTKFQLFKHVADYKDDTYTAIDDNDLEYFGTEYYDRWVVDGGYDYTAKTNAKDAWQNVAGKAEWFIEPNFENGTATHQNNPTSLTTWKYFEGSDYDNAGKPDTDADVMGADTWSNYKIWGYCLPNTILNPKMQKNGNTTGLVFKAQLSDDTDVQDENKLFDGENVVYAIENIVVGSLDKVKVSTTSAVKAGLARAQALAGEGEVTKAHMVAAGFSAYTPDEDGNYYCYYWYWNQHNESVEIMDYMEFAVVRNNVYKLAVSSVKKLGHPEDPNDDPDPDEPGDDDEENDVYMTVDCKVLPWTVRVNNIEF